MGFLTYPVSIPERLDDLSSREILRRFCTEKGISWSKVQDLLPKTVEYFVVC